MSKHFPKNWLRLSSAPCLRRFSIAGAAEYMIQHAKNVLTAHLFKTRNFTAVAGLSDAQNQATDGETDPVKKAKRRAWQVGGIMVTSLAIAFMSPKLILKNKTAEKAARKILTYA